MRFLCENDKPEKLLAGGEAEKHEEEDYFQQFYDSILDFPLGRDFVYLHRNLVVWFNVNTRWTTRPRIICTRSFDVEIEDISMTKHVLLFIHTKMLSENWVLYYAWERDTKTSS